MEFFCLAKGCFVLARCLSALRRGGQLFISGPGKIPVTFWLCPQGLYPGQASLRSEYREWPCAMAVGAFCWQILCSTCRTASRGRGHLFLFCGQYRAGHDRRVVDPAVHLEIPHADDIEGICRGGAFRRGYRRGAGHFYRGRNTGAFRTELARSRNRSRQPWWGSNANRHFDADAVYPGLGRRNNKGLSSGSREERSLEAVLFCSRALIIGIWYFARWRWTTECHVSEPVQWSVPFLLMGGIALWRAGGGGHHH